MNVDVDTINHLAELSNFSISEKECESLKKDLGEILKYVSLLDEVDVDGVEPTYQVFEMENVWREDAILPQEANRGQLLALSKEQKDNQVKVPKVL
ncbi:Asp-tRNA(Asn)/Glu-tRNA(Gln) amidotransferase subunit GatC [Candidatus Saccharibacteria bacterium]|nr:Asp-tRNA(Asn)/Glu-tRNA(Gln) amidotransferase subunit GatC [Candidatus Saccharibacteria bacterium]